MKVTVKIRKFTNRYNFFIAELGSQEESSKIFIWYSTFRVYSSIDMWSYWLISVYLSESFLVWILERLRQGLSKCLFFCSFFACTLAKGHSIPVKSTTLFILWKQDQWNGNKVWKITFIFLALVPSFFLKNKCNFLKNKCNLCTTNFYWNELSRIQDNKEDQ